MRYFPIVFAAASAFAALPALATQPSEVAKTYADIAAAAYGDSLTTAQILQSAVEGLVAEPTEAKLEAARAAWLAARIPYQQTEAYRFGNPIVDDWEGRVNAWPLDEGLIDYVDTSYGQSEENDLSTLNVIATTQFVLSGTEIDSTKITPELIAGRLHEADGIEANVASGYHAIEFLLWGQDLNGTGPGAGTRPHTDYLQGEGCTHGYCDRRADYLTSVTSLLVNDLQEMTDAWEEGGEARATIVNDPSAAILAILTGMGSLSYGEMAGQRMRLGLMLNDPEEEHDCFSDNTHNSHYYGGLGIRNVYLGSYTRVDGSNVSGPSLSDLVAGADADVDARLKAELDASMAALGALKSAADGGFAYDQMLAAGNAEGEALIMAGVNALIEQTASIERAVAALGLSKIEFEGSDSLQNPAAVFQ